VRESSNLNALDKSNNIQALVAQRLLFPGCITPNHPTRTKNMLKNTGIATILGLALMAGCATSTGSQSQDLATGDEGATAERCFHVAGDYNGSDVVPPPITIAIGERTMTAPDALLAAEAEEHEDYGRLLSEFVAAQVSIDGGADIDSSDIDVLIEAEDMLVYLDEEVETEYANEAELVDLINLLEDINEGFRIEAPCMDTDNDGVFEVDAPLSTRPTKEFPKWGQVIVGASAEDGVDNDDSGFHRPTRPQTTKHFPRLKAGKRTRSQR
jgi:hypothetical protein